MLYVLLGLIVTLSNTVETVLGFGNTVIAIALAAHFFPIDFLLTVLVPTNLLISIYLSTRYRRTIDWPALRQRVLPFMAVGLAVGLAVFGLARSQILRTGYGLFIMALGGLGLLGAPGAWRRRDRTGGSGRSGAAATLDDGAARPVPPLQAAGWLIGAGFFHGLYSSGGPMLVYYANRALPKKGSFRSTLSMVWVALNSAMVVVYAATGRITGRSLALSAALVPALLVAVPIGEWLHRRVNERTFRLVVMALLFLTGLSFVL